MLMNHFCVYAVDHESKLNESETQYSKVKAAHEVRIFDFCIKFL